MNIDPNLLPTIPARVRQWTYLLFLLILTGLNAADAFWQEGDPWWLEGALRAANVVGIVVTAIALANARPNNAEQAKKMADDGESPEMAQHDLGHPDEMLPRPLTHPDAPWNSGEGES